MFVNQVASQRTERVSVAGGVYPDVEAQITLPDRPSAGLVVVPGWNSSGNRPLFVEMARRYASMGVGTLRYEPAYCVDSQHVDLNRTTEEITALSSFAHARITPKTFSAERTAPKTHIPPSCYTHFTESHASSFASSPPPEETMGGR